MDAHVIGAAIISISGAFFLAGAIWGVIGALMGRHGWRPAPASAAHLIVSASIVLAGLVTHIVGFFPEAFVLLYAGGASMLVAAVFAVRRGERLRMRVGAPAALAAVGIVALTVGLAL